MITPNFFQKIMEKKSDLKNPDKIKKLTIVVNKDTYLIVVLFPSFSFIKNKNKAPIVGNNIRDERIGKFII